MEWLCSRGGGGGVKMFIVLTRWSVNLRNPKVPSYCLPLDLIQRPLPPLYNYTQSTVTVSETHGTQWNSLNKQLLSRI